MQVRFDVVLFKGTFLKRIIAQRGDTVGLGISQDSQMNPLVLFKVTLGGELSCTDVTLKRPLISVHTSNVNDKIRLALIRFSTVWECASVFEHIFVNLLMLSQVPGSLERALAAYDLTSVLLALVLVHIAMLLQVAIKNKFLATRWLFAYILSCFNMRFHMNCQV